MRVRLVCFLALLMLALAFPASAQQHLSDRIPLEGNAPEASMSAPVPSTMEPTSTTMAPRLPSGQGGRMSARAMANTPPLYVPGKSFAEGRPFTAIPAWAQRGQDPRYGLFPPFGANLFQGYFAGTYYEGMNSDYTIMPGDRISISVWGAHAFSETLMVDQQGNIFLPEVGPVPVAGIRHGQLQNRLKEYLASVFKSNVSFYSNLLTAQPVAVYVTGFVTRPGRYAGGMNDSILYYLDRAGGIIPERGSYRDITLQRGNKTIARADLYAFILSGKLFNEPLRDGDVIVVGTRGKHVVAGGLIPQQATYEGTGSHFTGEELIRLSSPLPATSHASVTGSRNATPFHVYMSLQEFSKFTLAQGDMVEFLADKPGDTIMVSVSGSIVGASHYPIRRNTTLRSLLAHVPVDGDMANFGGIYLKRRSVVEQQRKAIADALYRLEQSVLTTTSTTAEEATIRVKEAELVQNFVQRVSQLEPDGVVVVTRTGQTFDIILEDGDEVIIPQKSDVVQMAGEVMMPKAVVYGSGMSAKDYVAGAGGFTDRADKDNILVVHPNGEIHSSAVTAVMPGDLLLVMPRYDSKGFQIFKDLMQVLYQIAVATRVIVTL